MVLAGAAAAPAAVVEGFVYEGRTGLPLSRTRVTIEPIRTASQQPTLRTFTDSLGRFSFSQLPPGAYSLKAERRGYAPADYGQRRWNTPGTPVVLEEEARFAAEFRLSRLGAFTGRLSDENKIGLPDYQVFVYRDERPLRFVASSTTDDRGVYRVAGLEPGRYHARTGPRALEDGTELLPTYFGQTAAAGESNPFEVRLDEETPGVDITPLPGRLFRLGGRVLSPSMSSVALYSDLGKRVSGVSETGGFLFDQLSPGSYEIMAQGAGMVAYRQIWLAEDMDGLMLEPSPMPSVQVRCEERHGTEADRQRIFPFFRLTAPPGEPASQRILCDTNSPLMPGVWELGVATPPEYYVASVLIDGRSMDGHDFRLMPGQASELRIVVSSRPATLEGRVNIPGGEPAVGARVFLSAVDPDVERRLFGGRGATAGPNGDYLFEGLPPGRYRVLASYEYRNPEDVNWASTPWKTVDLEEGRKATLELEARR